MTKKSSRQVSATTNRVGLAALRATLPADRECDPAHYLVEGRQPQVALAPRDRKEVAVVLAAANRAKLAVVPQVGRSALSMGAPLARYDVALDLTELNRVIEHEPADLTLTVEAGVILKELAKRLAIHGQQLSTNPPGSDRISIGGLLATGRPGTWRGYLPGTRDLLLGATVALPDGTLARSGGRVVKNVAGYDLHRLHTGALGAFGVIVEATFKLVPLPEKTVTIACRCAHLPQASELAMGLRSTPLAVRGLTLLGARAAEAIGFGAGPHVLVGLAGANRALTRSLNEIRRACRLTHVPHVEQLPDEEAWARLSSFAGPQQGDGGDGTPIVLRGSLPSSQLGTLIAEAEEADFAAWAHIAAGSLLAVRPANSTNSPTDTDRARVAMLRMRCEEMGGTLTIEAGPTTLRAALNPTGGEQTSVTLTLARELRQRFDPHGTLNPGRWPGIDSDGAVKSE